MPKKKVAENCDQVREDDTSAKTDAHTNYDTKYKMIHNFFVSRLKKTPPILGGFFIGIKVLGLGDYTKFKQNPWPLFFVWVSLDNLMGNQ